MAAKKKAARKAPAKKKKTVKRHSHDVISTFNPAFEKAMSSAAPAAPKGSCRWVDKQGQFHCAENVTAAACTTLGGSFNEGGSC